MLYVSICLTASISISNALVLAGSSCFLDKQQRRAQRSYNTSKFREQEKCMGIDFEPIAEKGEHQKIGRQGMFLMLQPEKHHVAQ